MFLLLSACVIAAVSAGRVGELRALNHLVDKLDHSVEKLAKKERQVRSLTLREDCHCLIFCQLLVTQLSYDDNNQMVKIKEIKTLTSTRLDTS